MRDTRNNILKILFNNILSPLNIVTILLAIILIINKSYLYLIPLAISSVATIFQFCLDLKRFIFIKKENVKIHILENDKEVESNLLNLKIGDYVVLYPGEEIKFVGKIISGNVLVDESYINGKTSLMNKSKDSFLTKGMRIIEGSAVIEVTSLKDKIAKKIIANEPTTVKRIQILNLILSCTVLLSLLISFIFDKVNHLNSLDNVSKASISALPLIFNAVIVIYNFVKDKTNSKDVKTYDEAYIGALYDVDVVCLDKTGVITNGEYEIFKTIPLSQTALNIFSLDPNRALDQIISNIIKTTKEKEGYFKALQDRFDYDVSKIIDQSSSFKDNGLYSAITIRGGKTYAIGQIDNFDLSNAESIKSTISEYSSFGYQILVVVESKNPLKLGFIDGKCTAIGLIILNEIIRENIKKLIDRSLKNNKSIKVISGDNLETTSAVTRKTGIDNTGLSVSIANMSFEQLELLIDEYVVFTDASASQKAFIIKHLQKQKKKVLYIGDGDNDCPALKVADSSIALSIGTKSARRCAQIILDSNFDDFDNLNKSVLNEKNKLNCITSFIYAQSVFSSFFLFVFIVAKIFNHVIYNPFEYNHLMLWTILGVLIPTTLLLIDKDATRIKQRNFLKNFICDCSLLILPVGVMYILELLQYSGAGYFALPYDTNEFHEKLITSNVVDNLSYISTLLVSVFIVYNRFKSFNKLRGVVFGLITLITVSYTILIILNINIFDNFTQIDTSKLLLVHYVVMLIASTICAGIYLFISSILETIKGDVSYVKNKSRN